MNKINKRQLRVIAKNLITKIALSTDFDLSSMLSEEEEIALQDQIRQVACEIVADCFRTPQWEANKIVKDVLKNVK